MPIGIASKKKTINKLKYKDCFQNKLMHTGIRYISNSGFISRDNPRNAQNPIGRKSEIPFKLKNGIDISRFL